MTTTTMTVLVNKGATDCRGVVFYGRLHQPCPGPGAERVRQMWLTRLAAGQVEERDVPHRRGCRCIR
jgi:hypothetical protein